MASTQSALHPLHPTLRRNTPSTSLGSPQLRVREKGRGATLNPAPRFETLSHEPCDDGWDTLEDRPALKTHVSIEMPKTIITRNTSPDISFDRSVNPYRGCEHGCVYCYARPTHATLGLSPGLDFETKLVAKPSAPALLEKEVSAKGYVPRTIAIGANTDAYQPVERTLRIMRGVLEVLAKARHPVGIVTKSALITRDIDLLAPMAAHGLAKVAVSITTLNPELARTLEPRAPSPLKRLETIRRLTEAGIPVGVLVAPVIPAITDHEIERILEAARAAGACEAGYVLLRLPLEVRDLMQDWLETHRPDAVSRFFSLTRSTRGGKDYDATWKQRMTGTGPYAWMIGRRFEIATRRLGYAKQRAALRTDLFMPPSKGEQMELDLH